MAGDWIKMRVDLTTDPAVLQIAAMTGLDEDTVVGKLHRVWSWADAHTTDGHLKCGLTVVDRLARHDGFAAAMQAVGWLEVDDAGAVLPRFDIHNGKTAKARAQAAKRMGSKRKRDARRDGSVTVSVTAAQHQRNGSVTNCAPREEKRREEKKTTRKASSSAAAAAFMLVGFDEAGARRLADHPNAEPEYVKSVVTRVLADAKILDKRGWTAAAIERGGFDTTIPPPRAEPERWSATPDEAAEWARTAGEPAA